MNKKQKLTVLTRLKRLDLNSQILTSIQKYENGELTKKGLITDVINLRKQIENI